MSTKSLENEEGDNTLKGEDIKFKYPGTNKKVLNGVSFTAHPQKITAFVGSNGVGKSTLYKLLIAQCSF